MDKLVKRPSKNLEGLNEEQVVQKRTRETSKISTLKK